MSVSHMQEIWYLQHFQDHIRMLLQKEWLGEKRRSAIQWTVPYLPIDPQDVGRKYDSDVIRINSQSGKGGVNYILKQSHGINLPKEMREEVGYLVKGISDRAHKELTPELCISDFL